MAQTTFDKRLTEILTKHHNIVTYFTSEAIAEIKAAVIELLPKPIPPSTDTYPMNTVGQMAREIKDARISLHNQLIKDITDKIK